MLKKLLIAAVILYVLQTGVTIKVVAEQRQQLANNEEYISSMETYVEECATAIQEIFEPDEAPQGRYATIQLTERDRTLVALAIYHEGRGESFDGQRAIAEVIFNRVQSPKWPNTVEEVIYQDGQFDCASYLLSADIREPDKLSLAFDVVDYVWQSSEYVFEAPLMGFFRTTPYSSGNYQKLGNHYFAPI